MLEPKLIIADEPVASLDALNGNQVMDLLQHIVLEHGQTLFIITHNLSHVLKYCQYIYVLKKVKSLNEVILIISSMSICIRILNV